MTFQITFLGLAKITGDDGSGWLIAVILQALGSTMYLFQTLITRARVPKPSYRFMASFLSFITVPAIVILAIIF